MDQDSKSEPYLIKISPEKELPSHFFTHKGEETGYLLSGELQMIFEEVVYTVKAGDLVSLTSESPSQWKNPGPTTAELLWVKIK